MSDVAHRIRQARTDAGLSQASLAKHLHVDRSAVAQWEGSKGITPTVEHLRKLALVTGVSFEWLATGRGARLIGGKGQKPPAVVMDYIAQSKSEERLLIAFRTLGAQEQEVMLEKLEAIAKHG